MTTTHFVPTSEIKRLTIGSFEHLAAKIDEAVDSAQAKVFAEQVPSRYERIGTFGDHVVYATSDNRFVRVEYTESNGSISLGKSEVVDAVTYEEDKIGSYVMSEALEIVNSILAHDEAAAAGRLSALLPLISESKKSDSEVVEAVLAGLKAERPWVRIYNERKASILSSLGMEEKEFSPKYATTTVESKEIADDIRLKLSSYSVLSESLNKLASIDSMLESANTDEDRALVKTFGSFIEDLKLSLSDVCESVDSALNVVTSANELGRLYDGLAEQGFRYEAAGQFAIRMTSAPK